MADGRRLLTVCSEIPGLPEALRTLLPTLQVESVDPPLDPGVVDATDFLVAKPNFLAPVLDCPPSGERLRWAQNTWAGVDSLARMVEEREKLPSLTLARFFHRCSAGCGPDGQCNSSYLQKSRKPSGRICAEFPPAGLCCREVFHKRGVARDVVVSGLHPGDAASDPGH